MKKLILLLTCLLTLQTFAQKIEIEKTEKETFYLNNPYNFTITREDAKTKKQTFEAILDIPNKKNKEYYYPAANFITTTIVGNEIQIIYDVFNKKESKKICYIKTLNTKGSPLSEAKEIGSVDCKSAFSVANTIFKPIYSPDKTKFALLLDNYSKEVVVEPSITIYDTKKQTLLAKKELKSVYYGNKMQIDGNNNFKMDNAGNITLQFNTLNNETNLPVKNYQSELPFIANDLQNVKENTLGESNDGVGRLEQGRFYKSLEDFANKKPTSDYQIKNGGISSSGYKLVNKEGGIEKKKPKELPTKFFTYKRDEYSTFDLLKLYEEKEYLILTVGRICYYADYGNQQSRYYSEGIDGEQKKYKESVLEDYLEKYNLLEDYKKDKPKREFKDNVNEYFNKQVAREIKYFELLNKKMK